MQGLLRGRVVARAELRPGQQTALDGAVDRFLLLAARRLILGPEEGGLFTLFAIVFFLLGIALFGIGLLGEYIGRIYHEVRQRPRYLIAAILENEEHKA